MNSFKLYADGSYDLHLGSAALLGCYPGMDGEALHPMRVSVDDSSIEYSLAQGRVTLSFVPVADTLEIRAAFHGCPSMSQFALIHRAQMTGAERVFTQGLGMAGPTELTPVKDLTEERLGYGIAAFGSKGCYAVLYERDVNRFLSRITFCQQEKPEYPYNRWICRNGSDVRPEATFSFLTEGVNKPDEELPALILRTAEGLYDALRSAAEDIGEYMHARKPREPLFHFCSWYYQYHNFDQKALEEYVGAFRQMALPFQYIQVDVGYSSAIGDWLSPSHRFPGGLEKVADTICEKGYTPGIWVGAFMVGDESSIVSEHPDWLLKDLHDKPVVCVEQFNEPKMWGLRDSEYYVLDTSHPDAMNYLAEVFRTLRSMGYRLFKTDFMLWGLQHSQQVKRYTPGKTSVEYFRDTLKVIRESIGEDAIWLGCIAPFLPFVGYADAMRITGDVGAQWVENSFGPVNMIREMKNDAYFHNVFWQNDPDAVMLRDFHIYLTDTEVESLALLAAMSGGAIYTSDPMHKVKPERQELLRFIQPDRLHTPYVPDFDENDPVQTLVQDSQSGKLILLFNSSGDERTRLVDIEALAGPGPWYIHEYNRRDHGCQSQVTVSMPGHGSCLLMCSREPLLAQPENMWRW